ncbi:hypothetical protein [Scytonema sp. NUACC21]
MSLAAWEDLCSSPEASVLREQHKRFEPPGWLTDSPEALLVFELERDSVVTFHREN